MLTAINININRFVCLMDVNCVIYKDGNEYLYRVFHDWRHNLNDFLSSCIPKGLHKQEPNF